MSRSFLFLLGLVVVLGVGLGGAFIVGMVFGKSQGDATASVQGVTTFGPGGPPTAGFAAGNQPGGFQQRSRSAGGSIQNDTETGPALSGQRGSPGGGDGAAARSSLMGTVASIEGNTVTIDTPLIHLKARPRPDSVKTRLSSGL
jgi:hypothetical protein